jgi:ribosome biogenesis GTPase
MNLYTLGWSSLSLSEELDPSTIARITAVHRSYMRAATGQKDINVYLPGNPNQIPVVGDWVSITPEFEDEQGEPASVMIEVLPRKSIFARWTDTGEQAIAANVDTVFAVTSANQDFKLNRLHRFVLLIRKGGAEPVVVLSKTDLSENPQELIQQIQEKLQVTVLGTSVVDGSGINGVLELMPNGSTSVFVGSSGVGKSSLVNTLLGEQVQVTKEIRGDDDKGRHATTARQMFAIPEKGLIIDTPGIREVQVFGDEQDVYEAFPEIEGLIRQCKYTDCQHETEPDCAIQKALSSGDLDPKEWESFLKLQREVAFVQRKQNKAEMSNTKKRWRDRTKEIRKLKKE